jgi:hypothetical protein
MAPDPNPFPMDFVTASRICEACIRATSGFKGEIFAEDSMQHFGIEQPDDIENLVDCIVTDPTDGVKSVGFEIPNPNSLAVQNSTSFSDLINMVVKNSVRPKKGRP